MSPIPSVCPSNYKTNSKTSNVLKILGIVQLNLAVTCKNMQHFDKVVLLVNILENVIQNALLVTTYIEITRLFALQHIHTKTLQLIRTPIYSGRIKVKFISWFRTVRHICGGNGSAMIRQSLQAITRGNKHNVHISKLWC